MKVRIYSFINPFYETVQLLDQLKNKYSVSYFTVTPPKDYRHNNIFGFGNHSYFIFKWFNKIISRLNIKGKVVRYINEIIFDLHSAISLKEPSIIIQTNGFMPYTLKKKQKTWWN